MSKDRLCANIDCGKPLAQKEGETDKHFLRRRNCDQSCGSKAGHQRHIAIHGHTRNASGQRVEYMPWPRVTGAFVGSFAGMDVKPNDGGMVRLSKPVTHSPCGNAAERCLQ